jgi:hypothetical protein
MSAVDLRFTADRIAKLQKRNALAKQAGTDVDAEDQAELVVLATTLRNHPIKPHISHYGNKSPLFLATYDQRLHDQCCGYWYGVEHQAFAHTAFKQRSALLLWMAERGLSFAEELPAEGTYSTQFLNGQYRTATHASYDVFFSLVGTRTRAMSNSFYTMAIITEDDDGIKTVHTLSPNCADRPVYDRTESNAIYR